MLFRSSSTRCLFSYIPQGNTLFSGTIADNMRMVKPEASDEEIRSALEAACAWEFVEKLENGMDTEVRERGTRFSEGQKQRLSIARALLADAPVMILDEATSALDEYSCAGVPLFRRNGYRQSGGRKPLFRNRDTALT